MYHALSIEKIKSIKDHIDFNFSQKETIEEMAARFGINLKTLKDIFKQTFGKSPMEYRDELRSNEAKRLLSTTEHPIKAIGSMCGYATKQSFLNFFTRKTGMTPGAYRKIMLIRSLNELSNAQIKADCEAQYTKIKEAETRLKELRSICKHGDTFVGNYSFRVGNIIKGEICSCCGKFIKTVE